MSRPKGSYNRWLRWLPVNVHKKIESIIQYIQSDLRYYLLSQQKNVHMIKDTDPAIPEADARNIAAYARRNVDRFYL